MKNTATILIVMAALATGASGQAGKPGAAGEGENDALQQKRAELEVNRARLEVQRAEAEALRQQMEVRKDLAKTQDLLKTYRAARGAPVATRKENVAYCGVGTSEVPAVLAHQLKLAPGMGLVVDFVEPKSPADAAGVKQYDVLTRFNEQVLVNPEQFRVLVQLRQPSDDVKFSLIRQGEAKAVDVELGQKEIEVEVGVAATEVPRPGYRVGLAPDGELKVRRPVFDPARGGGAAAVTAAGGKRVAAWVDGQQTLNLEQDGNRLLLTVTDPTGKDVFRGPVETEAQRQALPTTIVQKLNRLEATLPDGGAGKGGGARVLTSTSDGVLVVARFEGGKAAHALAFSTADGRTIFEGPVRTEEQRKGLPDGVGKRIEAMETEPGGATEFGAGGR